MSVLTVSAFCYLSINKHSKNIFFISLNVVTKYVTFSLFTLNMLHALLD